MENNKKLLKVISITVIITSIVTFMATSSFFTYVLKAHSTASLPGSEKLFEVMSILDDKYYQDIDKGQAVEKAVGAMVSSLGDPYTTYMNKDEWAEFNTYITGTYSGVGLTVSGDKTDNKIVVISPFDGSPSDKAGIKAGDKIIKVNGEEVFADNIDTATSKMKGEKGTTVTLTVLKKDTKEVVDIVITRDEIKMQSVRSEMKGDIGYIRLSIFDTDTGNEFATHLEKMRNSGAKALIIDVRNNGGGVVSAVVQVAESLLKPDSMIFYTQDKHGKRQDFKTRGSGVDLPMVLLINEGSASASEILAGSLRDNKKATLVGNKSFGKGVVQQPVSLKDGSVVKVTVEKYFTPIGEDINKQGIKPDVEVNLVSEKDEQLQKAIEILNK